MEHRNQVLAVCIEASLHSRHRRCPYRRVAVRMKTLVDPPSRDMLLVCDNKTVCRKWSGAEGEQRFLLRHRLLMPHQFPLFAVVDHRMSRVPFKQLEWLVASTRLDLAEVAQEFGVDTVRTRRSQTSQT